MAEMYAVNKDTLTDIADAIRLKRDIVEPIPVDDMAMQIGLIEGGVVQKVFEDTVVLEEDHTTTTQEDLYHKDTEITFESYGLYMCISKIIGEHSISTNVFGSLITENTRRNLTNTSHITIKENGDIYSGNDYYGIWCGFYTNSTSIRVLVRANATYPLYEAGEYKIEVYAIKIADI